ncbi:MAG: hypothetical protein IAE83_17570 [Anaerolinea sp.]|nr:hypothetical protein [Anaerolinea sp.]
MFNSSQPPDDIQEEQSATLTMLFAVGSSVLVVVVVIVLIAVIMGQVNQSARQKGAIPYNLNNRPLPNTTALGTILPKNVGDFQRESLSGTIDNFSAVYVKDGQRLTLNGSRSVSVVAAQASVKLLMTRATKASEAEYMDDARPYYSYVLYLSSTQAHLAWSHERWFFEAITVSKNDLDAFMEIFEY